MQSMINVTFRHIERSAALEARVRDVGERLRRYNAGMTRCHLTVEGGLECADGGPYAVRIHLSVPGAQIHADSIQHNGAGHRDVYVALRDAYARARRQLQDLQRERKSSLLSGVRG
jgi:ribosome-associated translation inhibitor RaiA